MHSTEENSLKKKTLTKDKKNLLQNPKKAKKTKGFLLFQFSSVENQNQTKRVFFFFLIFLLKQHSSLTRGYNLNFQDKITNQNGEHPLKGESILHQHLFLLLSLLFLFCLISYLIWFFYYCVDYLLIIFIILYFDGWNDVNNGGDTQRPMVCHGLIM